VAATAISLRPSLTSLNDCLANTTVHVRTLAKAAELLGGERALARYLRVPMPELFVWMRGASPLPDSVFLRAVDLVLDDLELAEQARAQALRIASARAKWAE
jgi:hypothetical protein